MGWVLEVFKMGLYVSFPVGLFHYFNSPGNIEEDLAKSRDDYIDKVIGSENFHKRKRLVEETKRRHLEERDKRD